MDIRIENTPLCGSIRAISSKSDIHRFLLAAALANGVSDITFTTLSDDISAMINSLRALGAEITLTTVTSGYKATVRGGFCGEKPQIDALECGTVARMLLPVAAAHFSSFTMCGRGGLTRRPFAALCQAMSEHGAKSDGNNLPLSICGKLESGVYKIRGDESSQYISGLLFALPTLNGDSEIQLTSPLVSVGYVDMTLATLRRFGIEIAVSNGTYFIKGNQTYRPVCGYTAEGDWSNAAFWLCAGALAGSITVLGLNLSTKQKDCGVLKILQSAGANLVCENDKITVSAAPLSAVSFNGEDMPDALPVLAAMLTNAEGVSHIRGGARLRLKESDRIQTTANMILALGGKISTLDDGFDINGKQSLCGGVCDAANDHRIVMSAAILAPCTANGITICGAEAVSKSYPDFFNDFKQLGGNCHVIANR